MHMMVATSPTHKTCHRMFERAYGDGSMEWRMSTVAMLVVLSFDDDEQALTLIEDMLDHPDDMILTPSQENDVHGKVQALYKWPTQFHEPHETHGAGKTGQAFQLGQKFGWWICAVCKKPSRMYWETIVQKQSSFGKNLLGLYFDNFNRDGTPKKKVEEPV